MSDALVTQSELEGLLRRLRALELRMGRTEVRESVAPEMGTWLPTYTGATAPGVTTYTFQVGAYTRIGNVVIATGLVGWSAATGTGNAQILLPFTAANITNQDYSGSASLVSVTFANSTPTIELLFNTIRFQLRSPLTNAAGTIVQMEAAGQIMFTVTYMVDA